MTCPDPHLCQRLGRHIHGRLFDIWRGHDDAGRPVLTPVKCAAYRQRWEAAVGWPPSAVSSASATHATAEGGHPTPGPGTRLTRLLQSLNINATADCTCKNLTARMDREGDAWCRVNLDDIADEMVRNATNRGGLWRLVKLSPAGALAAAKLLILKALDLV